MATMPMTAEVLSELKQRGISVAASAQCHLPLFLKPPVRLYNCTLSNECRIDAFSYVSPGTGLHRTNVGRYSSIGDNVSILSSHPTERLTTHPFTYESIFASPFQIESSAFVPFENKLPITTIGHDVWIGSGVRIKSGVTIGDGCIVGAGSVVTKDIPAFSVVGGVPTKLIRPRFEEKLVKRIQNIQWWQYNLLGLKLPWDDVSKTLDELEKLVAAGELKPYAPNWIRLV